eukprot:scaffold23.g4089.t1
MEEGAMEEGAATELHRAAWAGDVAAIQRILAESPGDAMVTDMCGLLPLHTACCSSHAAPVGLLLAAAPEAASAADQRGWLPLHQAASRSRNAAVVEMLLAAAPGSAQASTANGETPLFFAAFHGNTAAAELLLGTAPEALQRRTACDWSPLFIAAYHAHLDTARLLLERSTASAAQLASDLLTAMRTQYATLATDRTVHALLTDLAATRALSRAGWAALPTPLPGLARALPAVLARSPAEAAQLVAHLPAAARGHLRTLALSVVHVQRQLGLELPVHIVRGILAAAPLED